MSLDQPVNAHFDRGVPLAVEDLAPHELLDRGRRGLCDELIVEEAHRVVGVRNENIPKSVRERALELPFLGVFGRALGLFRHRRGLNGYVVGSGVRLKYHLLFHLGRPGGPGRPLQTQRQREK